MNILLLENDSNKGQEIISLLQDENHYVVHGFCVEDIKKELSRNKYDILIVDLKVPLRNGTKEDLAHGLKLIQYVFDNVKDTFYHPKTVFVLTEYQDDEMVNGLWSYPVSVIPYSPTGTWKNLLRQRLSYYGSLQCDIAIITAVDIEFEVFYKWKWKPGNKVKDLAYYTKTIKNKRGENIRLILVKQEQMGMVTATNLTSKLINYFEPKCIIMGGICAGRKNAARIGDAIFAINAWDYGSGSIEEKKNGKKNELEFCPAPDYIPISKELSDIFHKYDSDLLSSLKNSVYKCALKEDDSILTKIAMDKNNEENRIHLGAMASGAAVIKNETFTNTFVKGQNKKYIGLDMETYGVYYAARHSSLSPNFFSVKSVSDVSDTNKGDEFQKYCAYISSMLIKYYIENDFVL